MRSDTPGDAAVPSPDKGPITQLLGAWSSGDSVALEQLIPLVYAELRRLAARHVRREGAANTLAPTGLVHEAFLRLAGRRKTQWQSRSHFFQLASKLMRQILVDRARSRLSAKRGPGQARVELDALEEGSGSDPAAATIGAEEQQLVNIVAVDVALARLEALDPQQAQIVELRFFGGLTIQETAQTLQLSSATVKRGWTLAKAWLSRELASAVEP
jgi:RNA polymerase sigma factor (TIGR02999 family)